MAKALTAVAVEKATASSKRREIPDGLLAGLYLVVQPSGAKSWAVRFRFGGRAKKLTLGPCPGVNLAAARRLAQKALVAVADGRDPCAEKKDARAAAATRDRDLFENIVADFLRLYLEPSARPSYLHEARRILKKAILPVLGKRPVQQIEKRDVIRLLDAMQSRGAGLTTNRTLALLKRIFSWCAEKDVLEASPCTSIKRPLPERSRDRVLTEDELRLIWLACDEVAFPFGPMVRLLMLTGQRRREVAGMLEAELNFAERVWTLPAERRKNGETNLVPLSDPALQVIGVLPQIGRKGLVFTLNGDSAFSAFSAGKRALDDAMREIAGDEIEAWRLHDLRRTCATGLQKLGIDPHVAESVLGHKIPGVRGVYQRHHYEAEKRAALDAWGSFMASLVDDPASNVVPFRKVAG